MFLSEPGRTNYDLNFNLFGFDIRVHPAFFILPAVLGANLADPDFMNPGVSILIAAIVFFISILVHELGHTFAFRRFGVHSRVVLYWMGGLAIPDAGWGNVGRRSLTSNQQIIVSLAGPFAGFLLGGVIIGIVYALGGQILFFPEVPFLVAALPEGGFATNPAFRTFIGLGIFINLFWGLINLAPVFPLDGGQVSREIFLQLDNRDGIRKSLILAVIASAALALWGFSSGLNFMGFLFAFMGISNYMTLQQMSGRGGGHW